MLINITTLKHRSGSLQAIVNSTIQEIAQEVLLIFHSNCGPILYCFRDIQPRIIVALEILVRGRSRSLKMVPFESFHTVTHSHSILTMALSYIISKTKWDIAQKSQFFIPPVFDAPVKGVPVGILPQCLYGKTTHQNGVATWRWQSLMIC